MSSYANDRDVTDQVQTTDSAAVNREIDRIFLELYPSARTETLDRAFSDATKMYQGAFPGFLSCDTPYHDIQHVLDVTLAMARLVDGYERSRVGGEALGEDLFRVGVITALFHDCGYIRRFAESQHANGAEFTIVHVSRGGQFLQEYLPTLGLREDAAFAADLIHFTGYERPVSAIHVPSARHRILGNLLGSADIVAQMSDRCYLEKCRDRLFPELVFGGIATKRRPDGELEVVYASGDDLLRKTPGFYEGASKRLEQDLAGGFSYAEHHFGGQNLYLEAVEKNIRFAEAVRDKGAKLALKRVPPETLAKNGADEG
jgi:hypothetical protein